MTAHTFKRSWAEWVALGHDQRDPFVLINSNGSGCSGAFSQDLHGLLYVLAHTPLDPRFERYGNFITENPCIGVKNPGYIGAGCGQEPYIDGPRMFDVDGVVQFFGNFYLVSHVFRIYTNDAETIEKLTQAIRANQASQAYMDAKAQMEVRVCP